MVKTYLKYEHDHAFGVICSTGACFDASGDFAVSGALENVVLWHVRRGELAALLKDSDVKSEVTEVAVSPDKKLVAVGYFDGSVRLWDIAQRKSVVTLTGHRSSVSALRFNASGSLLASGSRDTNVVVWDVISETGLYRLRGHKDMVTSCYFVEKTNRLITASKDTFIKIWDLDAQHCIQTLVGHRSEVWSFDVNPQETRLAAGSSDGRIRFWSLDASEFPFLSGQDDTSADDGAADDITAAAAHAADVPEVQEAKYLGSLERQSRERVSKISFNRQGTLLGCQAADSTLELFAIHSEDQIKKKRKKRKTRERRKHEQSTADEPPPPAADDQAEQRPLLSDELSLRQVVRASSKIKSFDFSPRRNQILLTLFNNRLEVCAEDAESSYDRSASIDLAGHRADIRDVALSSDDNVLASASNNLVKIWNVRSHACIRTMEAGYGLTIQFVPGNRHVILGTKEGTIQIFDLASGTCLESVQAHEGAVWSLHIKPDKSGLISGSADKEVKLWDFELIASDDQDAKAKAKRLTIVHTKTLKMSDDVLSVRFSPDGKFIAMALLDSTVKVFFADSFKFFLSLYGHKLPVMSLDISSDATLLVTGSADKNLKIWGLDFGDCHKSIFGHDDTITQVRFVPKTHYFFSCSKDKLIKMWDGDKFDHIQTLEGHFGHVWGLAISSSGMTVVSGSQDRSLRVWKRSDEQLFLDEERETAMEKLFDAEEDRKRDQLQQTDAETASAARRTQQTVKAGERLLEAIELADAEKQVYNMYLMELAEAEAQLSEKERAQRQKDGKGPVVAPPTPNPLLLGLSANRYVAKVIKDIRSAELEEALLVLPFTSAIKLFSYLNAFIEEGLNVELTCRCMFFLLKAHQNQIVSNKSLLTLMDSMKRNTRLRLQEAKDIVGFNRSAMGFLKRNIELNTNTEFFEASIERLANKKSKK
eukprot:TRINITY_DN18830_c0_g1_i1.p1 TRINITY_DN18830_c0_g1~~TRINITY_DN18830_c0_g1_i1.p1  ORF type:complete len:933 (-),score=243.72 TRINITY_DN18830_c0_g1_i1:56-2854(-)